MLPRFKKRKEKKELLLNHPAQKSPYYCIYSIGKSSHVALLDAWKAGKFSPWLGTYSTLLYERKA